MDISYVWWIQASVIMFWGTFFKDSSLHEGRWSTATSNGLVPRPRRASARPSSCTGTRLAGGKWMHLGHSFMFPDARMPKHRKNVNTPRLGLANQIQDGFKQFAWTSVCNEVYVKQQESQPSEFKAFPPWN